ncbi:hypothetical protein INR49_018824 [Caranx melampygus]|nr:hypothetical protein INR49_018824 [Caranx melampygus]
MEAAHSGLISITYLSYSNTEWLRQSSAKPDQRSRAAETTVTLRPLDVNSRRVVTVWKRPDDAGGWTEWRSVSFDECEV